MDALVTPSYLMITACARKFFIPPASMRWKIPRKILCGQGGRCRTLADVFRIAVFVARALGRAAMTAASVLLSSALSSSAGLLALDGARR